MTTIETYATADALRHCRQVTQHRARNFYHGLRLLPEPQRSALFAIYAWMRRADDIVDEAGRLEVGVARRRIDDYRARTVDALGGAAPGRDPVLVGLRDTAARFPLDAAHFHAMLDGQIDDLEGRRYATFDDLETYCRRVASSVGLVCISIWGHEAGAPPLAADRGIAFQLTNILRDVREDRDAGRVYLPREDFDRHGLTPTAMLGGEERARARAFLLEQIDRAESFYRRSEPLDDLVHAPARPALWAMTEIYRRLLAQMRKHPERIVDGPRVRLGALRKGTIAVRAKWKAKWRARRSSSPATAAQAVGGADGS